MRKFKGDVSRRQFLQRAFAGMVITALPNFQVDMIVRLQSAIEDAVGSRNIGVDVARFVRDGDDIREVYRVGVNQDVLRPTASCFKAWLPLYYYTFMPQADWDDSPGSLPYNVVVNSNNVDTGRLMQQVGELQSFGNPLEKFNDFLLYGLRLAHGISSWNWPGNPLVNLLDDRFSSGGERVVRSGGEVHFVGNVTTAADTLNGYRALYQRMVATTTDAYDPSPTRRIGALRTMRLLSLPGDTDYLSPIERVVGRGVYIGKDGILPADAISTGRVVNDAGLIPMETGMMGISFFSVRESEFSAMQILRTIIETMYAIDGALDLR